jgi:hypothetical protein
MFWKIMISGLMALLVGSPLAVISARADAQDSSTTVELTKARMRRYGPYATIRRANEVANYFRRLGYNARVITGGTLDSRVYYVTYSI